MRGETIDREYVENDVSATKTTVKRYGFEQLLSDVEARIIGTIVALSLDRLLRNNRDKYRLLEACQAHEVNIILAKGTDIDMRTAVGRMVADQLATAARFEVEIKAERQQSERQQAAEAGWAPPSRRAFGYRTREKEPGKPPTVRLHEDEAPLVAEAYRRVLNGATMGSVARWLNGEGSTTTGGKKWTHHNLHCVLVNPKYKGVRAVRQLLPGREGMAGKREKWHTEIAPGQWEPIVTVEVWDGVQMILRDPERRKNHPVNTALYLLTGIGRCAVCDAHLIGGSRTYILRESGERAHQRLIRCSSLAHISRRAEPIEDAVETYMLAKLADPRAMAALRASGQRPDVDLDALQAQEVNLRGRRDEATREWTDGTMDTATRQAVHRQVDERLASIARERLAGITTDPLVGIASAVDPVEVWQAWPMETKRALVRARLDVIVHPGKSGRPGGRRFDPQSVEIHWRE